MTLLKTVPASEPGADLLSTGLDSPPCDGTKAESFRNSSVLPLNIANDLTTLAMHVGQWRNTMASPDSKPRLTFPTTNPRKFEEARLLAAAFGIELVWADLSLREEDCTQEEIVTSKASQAFARLQLPVVVDDTALYVDGLESFPGTETKRFLKHHSLNDFLDRVSPPRKAVFRTLICFRDAQSTEVFCGELHGKIVRRDGFRVDPHWQYNDLFVPTDETRVLSQIPMEERILISHRARAFECFGLYWTERCDNEGHS